MIFNDEFKAILDEFGNWARICAIHVLLRSQQWKGGVMFGG